MDENKGGRFGGPQRKAARTTSSTLVTAAEEVASAAAAPPEPAAMLADEDIVPVAAKMGNEADAPHSLLPFWGSPNSHGVCALYQQFSI